MKKRLSIISVILLVFVMTITDVFAAPANTIKVNASKAGPAYVAGTKWAKKVLSDGSYAYCLNHHKATPYNQTLAYKGVMDAGFAYIILNGYPKKSLTGNADYDYYITQGAIHWYQDRINGVSDSKSGEMTASFKTNGSDPHKLRPHMKKLVTNALKARSEGYVLPTANLSVASKKMHVSSDRSYFISDGIKLTTKSGMTSKINNISVKVVSGPSGTKIVNGSGKTKSSFSNGDTFYVKVPTSSLTSLKATVKISMSGNGTVSKVARYARTSNVHGNVQDLTAAKPFTEPTSFKQNLEFNLTSTTTEISKVDITTQKELPGATLVVKNSSGKVVEQWVSTNQTHIIKALPAGTYTLTETIAPAGYVRAQTIKFTVKEGQTTKVKMEDDYTKVDFSKVDITTQKELPGATLVIKDANGKVIEEWVSTNEKHRINRLPIGTYTLTETIAPDGYVRAQTIKFTVTESGKVSTVKMEDDYTKVEISKQDVTNKKELPGAKLKLYDEEGKVIAEWTSSDKAYKLEKLKVGKYKLVEEVAPEGYVLAKEAVEFKVLETGDLQKVVMFNTPLTPTPDTAFHPSTLLYIAAAILGCFGIGLVYWNAKQHA